jgi:hypothetical protein
MKKNQKRNLKVKIFFKKYKWKIDIKFLNEIYVSKLILFLIINFLGKKKKSNNFFIQINSKKFN